MVDFVLYHKVSPDRLGWRDSISGHCLWDAHHLRKWVLWEGDWENDSGTSLAGAIAAQC